MESLKDQPIHSKKEFIPKDAITVFGSFTFICMAVIFIFVVYDLFTIQHFLSFSQPISMAVSVVIASMGLIMFGVILTLFTPSNYIDETNMSYQNYSVLHIFGLCFSGHYLRSFCLGDYSNFNFSFADSWWTAIIITTLLFYVSMFSILRSR